MQPNVYFFELTYPSCERTTRIGGGHCGQRIYSSLGEVSRANMPWNDVSSVCFFNLEVSMNTYFGKVGESWAGFSSEYKITLPYFDKEVEVFLGEEFDDDGEEISTPPSHEELSAFEETLKSFLENIDSVIVDIQRAAFEYYHRVYAKYYEKPFVVLFDNSMVKRLESGELHPPLTIDSHEKHFLYMTDIVCLIRVLDNKTIKIPIHYALDEEHGLEIKIVNNRTVDVGGIAET